MCRNPTKEEEQVLCSRCGNVANPDDGWENDWPNYGQILLGFNSVIHWPLLEKAVGPSFNPGYHENPIVKSVISGKHPAVKLFGAYQSIIIEWSAGDYPASISKKYRLCRDCQRDLLTIIGEFFFKTLPAEQPIKAKVPA